MRGKVSRKTSLSLLGEISGLNGGDFFVCFYFLHQCLHTDIRSNDLRSNSVLKCIMIMSLMSIKKR